MHTIIKNTFYVKCLLVVVLLCLLGFSCARKPSPSKVAIKVNDYTLAVGEFNELFAELKGSEGTPEKRKDFAENLITRKLLLQEAQKQGLDKQKDFLKSIENFWEQSLLKIVVDRKAREVLREVRVTEQEVQDYYNSWAEKNPNKSKTLDELRPTIKWVLLKERQTSAISSWIEQLKQNADIKINKKALGIE